MCLEAFLDDFSHHTIDKNFENLSCKKTLKTLFTKFLNRTPSFLVPCLS